MSNGDDYLEDDLDNDVDSDLDNDNEENLDEKLIEFIAQSLVERPEEVEVYTKQTRRTDILKLQVASEDMGRVIGRNGRVANAIRTLLRAATRDSERPVILEID